MAKKIAVIRVRGKINRSANITETLKRMSLHKQNSCVIIEEKPDTMGMVRKVKDFVTWGTIDEDVEKELNEKFKDRKSKFFALNPPRKGYGRKGIKKSFTIGGALGNRGQKINDLLKRMIQ